jgi:hypothetical protein
MLCHPRPSGNDVLPRPMNLGARFAHLPSSPLEKRHELAGLVVLVSASMPGRGGDKGATGSSAATGVGAMSLVRARAPASVAVLAAVLLSAAFARADPGADARTATVAPGPFSQDRGIRVLAALLLALNASGRSLAGLHSIPLFNHSVVGQASIRDESEITVRIDQKLNSSIEGEHYNTAVPAENVADLPSLDAKNYNIFHTFSAPVTIMSLPGHHPSQPRATAVIDQAGP